MAVEPEPQTGEVGDIVVGDFGFRRFGDNDRTPGHDVGELRIEPNKLCLCRGALHAQDEIAVDVTLRVEVREESTQFVDGFVAIVGDRDEVEIEIAAEGLTIEI